MLAIVHPLADELGGLVETDPQQQGRPEPVKDTSWRWMLAIAVAVGLFAWFTR